MSGDDDIKKVTPLFSQRTSRPKSALDGSDGGCDRVEAESFLVAAGAELHVDDSGHLRLVAGLLLNDPVEEDPTNVRVGVRDFLIEGIKWWATMDQAHDGQVGTNEDGTWNTSYRNNLIDGCVAELTEVIETIKTWKYQEKE